MNVLTRLVLSLLAIILFGWINGFLSSVSLLAVGQVAGQQLESSDTGYIASQFGMHVFNHMALSVVVLIAVLAMIWWSMFRKVFLGLAVLALASTQSAQAYYSKSRDPEGEGRD